MNQKQFTYLIGAGASAETLPVITEFAQELFNFADFIEKIAISEDFFHNTLQVSSAPSEIKTRFVKEIKWLAEECDNHSSVDTFARKLFLANREKELIKLKAIVSEFLLTQQFQKGIDKRYDAFFATILDKSDSNGLILPNNIKIVSWNYDKQIEFSTAQFSNKYESDYIENFLQVFPRPEGIEINLYRFCVFKMNGTIGGTLKKEGNYKPIIMDYSLIGKSVSKEVLQNIVKNILFRFYTIENRIQMLGNIKDEPFDNFPTILYSWEEDSVFKTVRNNALKATRDTNILVIIGYSFPTFNRTIDKNLLHNMGRLEKVFIQSPESSIKGVMQRFNSLYEYDVEIEPITNVEEFYIPFEY